MQITFYGHGCLTLETQGCRLLVDPFLKDNPLAPAGTADHVEADYILLTHAHGDHVADAADIARRTGASIISNYEIVSYYEQQGLKGHPMNLGGKFRFPFGTLKSVTALHSSVFPDGTYGGNPGGFVIWNDEGCLYLAGDTALTLDMQLIPLTCPPLTAAVLPIGDNFTMGWEDAAIAASWLKTNHIIGCHYDTFGYIEIDKEQARQHFDQASLNLQLPLPGETITL